MIESKNIADLTECDFARCQALLEQSSNKHIFNDVRLHVRAQKYYNKTARGKVLFIRDGSQDLGYIIIYTAGKWLLQRQLSPYQGSLITYGGLTKGGNELNEYELLKQIKAKVRFNQYLYVKTVPQVDPTVYQRLDFQVMERKTLYINTTQSEEELWADVDNRIKRNIKKAWKAGIVTEVIKPYTMDDVEPIHSIYADLCARTGLKLHDQNYYHSILDNTGFDHSLLIVGRLDGKIISAMTALVYDVVITPWFGGTLTDYKDSQAGSLIYWQILKYAAANGYKLFDFLGLDHEKIAFYKKGFGGYEVPVYHAIYKPKMYRALNYASKILSLTKKTDA